MSFYSEKKYAAKLNSEDLWFERLYFDRWFKGFSGPILDVGCATGNFIATHPEIIEGLEIDEDSLKICAQRHLRVKKADANRDLDDLPPDHYQGVYAKQVIEHLDSPLDFLYQIKRILKPGGRAVILTPNCPYAVDKGIFWLDKTHQHPLTRENLLSLASEAGFSEIVITEDFRCFPGLGRLIRWFNLSPEVISKLQRMFFIRGLSLILVLKK